MSDEGDSEGTPCRGGEGVTGPRTDGAVRWLLTLLLIIAGAVKT